MMTLPFWKATFERMIRTFAQAVLALLTGDGLGLVDVDWGAALSVGGLAAVAALLTAIVASGGTTGPGITETVATADTPRGPTSI
ncbi:holin [Streptomyces sp. NBC_01016]|uniref:holin n=1 Tax=Streptomyces sp. NBC_01016 TaxID=2903720 RepID=UPI00225ACE01|nr:holin [Streptomyces sp. NBC_01016]MCX4827196.1 holin [Streptomyces sp. NBC_01016]